MKTKTKTKTKTVLLITLLVVTSSCMNYILGKYGVYDDKISLTKKKLHQKEIVFFGMHHIGTPSFYEDVSKKVDSLNELGYIFYLEGVKIPKVMNSKGQDTFYRKFRKVSGIPQLSKGHLDTLNNTILAGKKKIKMKTKLINQPSYSKLGIDTLKNAIVDVPINKLVLAYEEKNGDIFLETCDFQTPVNMHSDCDDTIDKNFTNEFIIDFRNEFITNHIIQDTNNKIALIYGKAHFTGIKKLLEEQGYKQIE